MDSSEQEPGSTLKSGWRLRGPIHAERFIRVICVGAGASGLLLAYKLQKHFSNFRLTIYEKNSELSGTWWENRYPGCACDVPSHNYTWSFEPSPDWSAVYADSKQIFDYFNNFSRKYGLDKFVKTEHQVTGAYWNAQKAGWEITIQDLVEEKKIHDFCDVFINASGVLNNWRWPDVEGLDDYRGVLLHTANWDDDVQLEGKRVGLIGNGSSAIQVLPAIQPVVQKLTTFIRSPTWVSPVQGFEQHVFTEQERRDFATKPGALTEYRKDIERSLNGQFSIFLKDTASSNGNKIYMTNQMKQKLSNPSLEEKLIPKWAVGCRRFTPGVGYLEALGKENVEVVHGAVTRITEKGCISENGQEYPLDILICATGFDVSFRPRFPIIGFEGKNLQDEWKDEPQSYFGVAAAGFPNYLTMIGPNTPVGNGPVLSAVEAQADYILSLIDHYQTHNHATFTPSRSAVSDFIAHKNAFMKKTVWTDPCRSWYKSHTTNGPVTALWPGSTLHYIEAISYIRFEDWDIGYASGEGGVNRYEYLGNGYSQTELDDSADWGYYIRERDDGPPLSRAGRLRLLNKSGSMMGQRVGYSIVGDGNNAPREVAGGSFKI